MLEFTHPDQYAVIQSVYKDIVSQAWFSKSPEKQRKFAVSVINAYRGGLVGHDELRSYCWMSARRHFMNYDAVMSEPVHGSDIVGRYPARHSENT